VDTRGKKKKRTSKKNVDGRCTSIHENKTFRRSVVKQKGMVFGFRKTATAVTRPERQKSSVFLSSHIGMFWDSMCVTVPMCSVDKGVLVECLPGGFLSPQKTISLQNNYPIFLSRAV